MTKTNKASKIAALADEIEAEVEQLEALALEDCDSPAPPPEDNVFSFEGERMWLRRGNKSWSILLSTPGTLEELKGKLLEQALGE